jgi:hypothetical protein
MHVNKSLKLLKKINTVFHTILEDSHDVSKLEQALLKSYVVQFYDAILEEDTQTSAADPNINIKNDPDPIEAQIDVASTYAREDRDAETPARPSNPPSDEKLEVVANSPEKSSSEVPTEDLLAPLFEEVIQSQSKGHIGERLISDMKKSMGLNDKLMFANVLFGGNQSQLLETLEEMNQASKLVEVKDYLNNLAKQHSWTEETKHNSVVNFLSLVVRKFDSK